ncbi:MAG: DUF896 domain-containing protein [Eubacteriales bacterium]|nr:DUF896 domain-containing protein [Eubacteriales bacterium]
MEHEKILRINELARLSRERALTDAEKAEQAALRQEYIAGFRANMEQVLQNVSICDEDGTVRPLRKKTDQE